jgi:hypothetical protein
MRGVVELKDRASAENCAYTVAESLGTGTEAESDGEEGSYITLGATHDIAVICYYEPRPAARRGVHRDRQRLSAC